MKPIYFFALWLMFLISQVGHANAHFLENDTSGISRKTGYQLSTPFPNPVNNLLIFNYQVPQQTKTSSIHIFDLTGKKVSQVQLEGFSGQVKMNLENFSNGIYFYTLYLDGKAIKTGRFVKRQV